MAEQSTTPAQTIMSRTNEILTIRAVQLHRNRLCVEGGRRYIDERLWRAPNESELSWTGNRTLSPEAKTASGLGTFGVVGRKDRTTYVNDAGRVSGKIQQYLFKEPVARAGADEEFLGAMGGRNVDELQFWMDANEAYTASQWIWIQASREAVAPNLRDRTRKDMVRWTLYPSVSVPDWNIDPDTGEINWLIAESFRVENADPFTAAVKRRVRTLWRKEDGGVRVSRYSTQTVNGAGGGKGEDEKAVQEGDEFIAGLDEIPFVLVGRPSPKPWWFDDVENLQAQMLNLDSLHVDNLTRTVFPQLVISMGTFQNLDTKLREVYGADRGEVILKVVRELVRGVDTPIVEDQGEGGITRFISPNAGDLAALPNEIERKRRLLFDITGLSLFNKESRMAQTAESKQFDQLDTESTLKNRSAIMRRAEESLIAISEKLDPTFKHYDPVWPTSFDVTDPANDLQAVGIVSDLPDAVPSLRKMAMKCAVRVVASLGGADKELVEAANKEIDEADFTQEATPPEDQPLRIGAGANAGEE